MHEYTASEASLISRKLSDERKREALDALSEDEFRDKVIRPLYRHQGLTHLRDVCGPDEEGKDCLFLAPGPLGEQILIAVQTKAGPISMPGTNPNNSLIAYTHQLEMALKTSVVLDDGVTKLRPLQAHLCASGKISNSARNYLFEHLDGERIKVLGSDQIIEMIDKHFHEFWLGVDAERFPYVKELRRRLCCADDVIRIGEPPAAPGADCPALDGNYVQLKLTRMEEQTQHRIKTTELPSAHQARHKRPDVINTTEVRRVPKFVDVSVDSILNQGEHLILITGEGGAGKTTALRRLAVTLIDKVLTGDKDATVPVVLKAKQIAAWKKTLTELLAAETMAISGGQSPFGNDDLETGKLAILIDALEEVDENGVERSAVLDTILEFHKAYPECPIVLTSRDYRSVLELLQIARFQHYWILPIGLKEADALITRAIERKTVDREVVRTTIKKLHEHHGMNLSPMLLTVFLSSSDFTRQDLPPNIAEIFAKFTEQMIGRWDEKKGLGQQYEAKTKDYLLRKLAFQMHQSRLRSIPLADVRRLFDVELKKTGLEIDRERIIAEVVERSGLLRQAEGDSLEWRHHVIQEYFAGRGVPNAAFFESVASDEWWRVPMVFYFGSNPENFTDLWKIVENTSVLDLAALFDAAITIGLSVQACYLADIDQKVKTLSWVVETFAKSMDEFRKALDGKEGGGKEMMGLCGMIALGRDAIGARTLARMASVKERKEGDALFEPLNPDRVEAWRIIGLLEATELVAATQALSSFKPDDRELIFMVHLSVAWAIYSQNPTGELRKVLQIYLENTGEIIDDMRQKLFKELKSLFFQIRSGKVTAVEAEAPPAALPPT